MAENKSREYIVGEIQEADMRATFFLMSLQNGRAIFQKIVDDATRELKIDAEFKSIDFGELFGGFCPDGEGDEAEETFPEFAKRYARLVRKAGTKEWFRSLDKGYAEMLINGLNAAGICKIELGNGEKFSAAELLREWEESHGETLKKKGFWDAV